MSGLVVGGTTIPIASSGQSRDRPDWIDRARAFDGTYRASQVGGAVREWKFQTPPVTRTLADTYEVTLASVVPLTCSGDILSIATMCCPEITGWTPVATSNGSHYVVIDFTLHEVQPAYALLRYSPGDTITGESFTRSTAASYRDANGLLQSAAINTKRDGNYYAGIKSLLLEDTRTNICLQSEVLGTTWAATAATIGTNATTAPTGAATADKIQEDNTTAIHGVTQTITCASAVQTFSIWVKSFDRTKCVVAMNDNAGGSAGIGVDLSNGTTFAAGLTAGSWTAISSVVESWGSSWYRVMLTATRGAGTQTVVEVFTWTTVLSYLGSPGSGIYAFGGQLEMNGFASSYIATTTLSVVRGADFYSLPFMIPPQEMSVYLKFIELGPLNNTWLYDLSIAANTGARFFNWNDGGYTTFHSNGTSTVESTALATTTFGQTVEVEGRLYGDGSVDASQNIASAASTATAQTAALALATTWSAQLAWLGSPGTVAGFGGFLALQSFKIVAGARSMEQMRAL